jgi:hypothetical protein
MVTQSEFCVAACRLCCCSLWPRPTVQFAFDKNEVLAEWLRRNLPSSS